MPQRIPVIINGDIHYFFQWSHPHPELSTTSVSAAPLLINVTESSSPHSALHFTSVSTAPLLTSLSGLSSPHPALSSTLVSTAPLVASVTPASPRELHILPEDQAEVDSALLDVTMKDEDEVAN